MNCESWNGIIGHSTEPIAWGAADEVDVMRKG